MSPLGGRRRLEVSKTEDSDIAANNIEELIEQVLLRLNQPLDRVLFAHSADGGYINIRTGSDGSRTIYHDGRAFDPIQIMYFSVPPNRRRQGLYKRFIKSLETCNQYGMLWIDGVEDDYLRNWLQDWDYLRRDRSFYKIIGAPLSAFRQEIIERELEEFEQAVSSIKRLRCWVKRK